MTGALHDMPFGAQCLTDGEIRFRLWAPAVEALSLVLEDSGRAYPMEPVREGWFELVSAEAGVGSRYRYELPDGLRVPDPASRRQDGDVHDASVIVDPAAYSWRHPDWKGRPWRETVLYEIHVGTFSAEGNFEGVRRRLPALAELGITAIELMPIADFPGRWNWGYDGVLLFAPDSRYGAPEDLKRLVDSAHELGMMVFLDVVYNHFGPDGNYLHRYAPQTFTDRSTPWGMGIDWSCGPVRDFFAHNAAYWIEEYRIDGLRLDAVHAILDDSRPHVLDTIARAARKAAGPGRLIHLVLENDNNAAGLIGGESPARARPYDAQWNDDFHHAAHVLLTGEGAIYYADYAQGPAGYLGRALAEGFAYQGEYSGHRKRGRGEPTASLTSLAFVNFLQNHDQVGNRAFGERLIQLADPHALRALSAVLLLAPSIPLLFMGEEHAAPEPFLFFVDFPHELAQAVRTGRRRELAGFPGFDQQDCRGTIPDPTAESSYSRSVIDWARQAEPFHRELLNHCRNLLTIRAQEIVPRLANPPSTAATFHLDRNGTLTVAWAFGTAERLTLLAHLSPIGITSSRLRVCGRPIWTSARVTIREGELWELAPWFVGWFIADFPDSSSRRG
jgi:maltooligosyltrehalose trehalohydrolase